MKMLPDIVPKQLLAVCVIALSSLSVGFTLPYMGRAIVSIRQDDDLKLSKNDEKWAFDIIFLAAAVGALLTWPLLEYLGRRITLLVSAWPFIIGWLIIGTANKAVLLLTGRFITGIGLGMVSVTVYVYLVEILASDNRGALGLFPAAFNNLTIVIFLYISNYIDWVLLAYIGILVTIPYFIATFFIQESKPIRLVEQDYTEPRKTSSSPNIRRSKKFKRPFTIKTDADVQPELKANAEVVVQINDKRYGRPLGIVIGMMVFQNFSGISAVPVFAVNMFQTVNPDFNSITTIMVVALVNLLAIIIAIILVDIIGRKLLLYISGVGMIMTLITLGVVFFLTPFDSVNEDAAWKVMILTALYSFSYSIGYGPLPWLMMGEILPGTLRSVMASLAACVSWLLVYLTFVAFQNSADLLGHSGTVWVYATICIISLVFTKYCVPETAKKSLEEIEKKVAEQVKQIA